MKYPFALVTLIWVYLALPSFFLKALCARLLILDFNRSCEIEVQSVEKSNVWTDVAVCTSSWSSDDNKLVEFFRIHMLLTPLWLVLVLQYLTNRSFMVLSTLVRRHDRSFVVQVFYAEGETRTRNPRDSKMWVLVQTTTFTTFVACQRSR